MNSRYRNAFHKWALTVLMLGMVLSATAQIPMQGNFKVSQLSDKQIMQLWQRAQKSGMSETEAIEELVKRGLSASEVNQFKQRIVQVQSQNKSSDRKSVV